MLFSSDYKMRILSSLVKVMPGEKAPKPLKSFALTALRGETVSFQVSFTHTPKTTEYATCAVESDLSDEIRVRQVSAVPVLIPCNAEYDDNYISVKPGLYPDLLQELHENTVIFLREQWNTLWVDVEVPENAPVGEHKIKIAFISSEGKTLCSDSVTLTIYEPVLEPQSLIHTEWFYCDCLADYYHVEPWSEKHWQIVESFVKVAVKRGMNMMLTPIHTPPLDTYVGGERTNVQLIDITVDNGRYSFGVEKLLRFIKMCRANGIKYFEMAHLFTQWGCAAAPNIYGVKDGVKQRLFGWDTPAVGGEYTRFLQEYLKAVREALSAAGVAENTFFHISDEPGSGNLEAYTAAKASVKDALEGAKLIDALSDFELYSKGVVTKPIPSNDHIEPFINGGAKNLWTYYCVSQGVGVSNRFIAMPSARNRAIGVQMYLYDIEGFLHWGFNFYNSMVSKMQINPYSVNGSYAFPAGDPFLVYPGADGQPEESIRIMVFYEALTDMRALKMLEKLTTEKFVENLINEEISEPITFKRYPCNEEYYIKLRNRVNAEIAKFSAQQ